MAVVYAVMVETGLNETDLGKLILAACFITDLGTVLALGLIFANYDYWLLIFVVVTGVALWRLPAICRWVFARWGGRVSEPEIKFIFLVLCALGGPGGHRPERSRAAGLSLRHGDGRPVRARQGPHPSACGPSSSPC